MKPLYGRLEAEQLRLQRLQARVLTFNSAEHSGRIDVLPRRDAAPATGPGLFYVKCCLAVIDSQKLCGLNCSRGRWLLQEPALSPGRSLNHRGAVHLEGPRDHLRWLPGAQAPVVGPNFPPGPPLHCVSQKANPLI